MSERINDLEEMAEVISIALGRERASIEYYSGAFDKAKTENARRIFSLLIEQERGHEAKLRAQLHEIQSEIELERLKKGKK